MFFLPIVSMYGIFTDIWLIFMVNVGKYTSPMDPMGYINCHQLATYCLAWQEGDETAKAMTIEQLKLGREERLLLLVVGCWLFVVCCLLLVACCLLLVACCLLLLLLLLLLLMLLLYCCLLFVVC